MALVTLQRSPSPSNDPEEDVPDGGEDTADGKAGLRHKRSKSTLERLRKIFSTVRFISKLRPCLSESYFTIKGAALILPHNDLARKTSKRNHGGEIQRHLQSMLYILRPEDKIKVAIRLEGMREGEHRYMALVSTIGRQDTEESVILGLDCGTPGSSGTPSPSPVSPVSPVQTTEAGAVLPGHTWLHSATVGLVLPIWMGMKARLSGDGGFSISVDDKSYLFKPVSVQAMWSAIQSLDKSFHIAEQLKYLPEGLTHTWVEYYRSKMDFTDHNRLSIWHQMEDVEVFAPSCLSYKEENESEKLKLVISAKLKEVMMSVDLDEATSKFLRTEVEKALGMNLDQYLNYFDEETLRILGQMDAPSQILDFLYLGSEWNASNLEELQRLGIKYILNVTREIDNFFTGLFHYCNVRLYDHEDSELMKHWLKTYKFINKAKKHDSKVLVHCKMGISRSASTVMAYLMKENCWPLDKAFTFVKDRRSCVRPNKGFMEQLQTYEGILNASNMRKVFLAESEQMFEDESEEGESERNQQGNFLGDSLFQVMVHSDWPQGEATTEETTLLRKSYDNNHEFSGMEADLETRSADSLEESAADMSFPMLDVTLQADSPTLSVTSAPDFGGDGSLQTKLTAQRYGDAPGWPGAKEVQLTSRIRPDHSWIKLECSGESSTDITLSEPGAPEGMALQTDLILASAADGSPCHRLLPPSSSSGRVASPSLGISSSNSQGSMRLASLDDAHKIKPDSSWIRLYSPGESSTDVEEMDTTEAYQEDASTGDVGRIGSLQDSRPVQFVLGEDEEMTPAVSSPLKIVAGGKGEGGVLGVDKSTGETLGPRDNSQQVQGVEMGVQQYYSREQIPWSKGKVRNLLIGLQQGGQMLAVSTEEGQAGLNNRPHQARDEDPSFSESLGMTDMAPMQMLHCQSCMELSYSQSEAVDLQDRPSSVNDEQEEIFPTPGTVRRTLQEIEERNRLHKGETIYGMKGVQRSSSFKEGLSKSSAHNRQSERRWTCTPILSPDHSSEDLEGQGFMIATAPVNLGLTTVDSSKDAVKAGTDMVVDDQQDPVRVYTYKEDAVPVKLGTVWRHTLEIESKAGDGNGRPRALSESSGGSSDSGAQVTGSWSPIHGQSPRRNPDIPVLNISLMTSNIPEAKSQRTSSLQQSCVEKPQHAGSAGVEPECLSSSVQDNRGLSSSSCRNGDESSTHGKGVMPLGWSFKTEAEDQKKSVSSLSPSTSSAPRKNKGNFDSETLALIREIGSAFVATPTTGKFDDGGGAAKLGLVRHLVKNIEKETNIGKRERKIVIISKDSAPGQKGVKSESQDCVKSSGPEHQEKRDSQTDMSPEKLVRSSGKSSPEVLGQSSPHIDEHPPSVVRHLRGKFETRCHAGDGVDDETLTGTVPSIVSNVFQQGDIVCDIPVVLQERKHDPSGLIMTGIAKAKSFDEQSLDFLAGDLRLQGMQPVMRDQPVSSCTSTQPSRRPCSANNSSGEGGLAHRYSTGGCTTSHFKQHEERAEDERGGEEVYPAKKLYGKSHPLSKLQPYQGDCTVSPSPGSRFYPTM